MKNTKNPKGKKKRNKKPLWLIALIIILIGGMLIRTFKPSTKKPAEPTETAIPESVLD